MSDTFSPPIIEAVHAAASLATSDTATIPTPSAIIAEYSAYYIVCFDPDIGGVITTSPHAVPKSSIAAVYPEIAEAWDRKKVDNRDEALRVEQKINDYAYFFQGEQCADGLAEKNPGVACDQKLLAGMKRHWGELRQCATHPREGSFLVCKGCRVAHHAQPQRGFDRNVMMTEGARVPVCTFCAEKVVLDLGVGYRGCVCDRDWMCFRCREDVLERLARARKRSHVDGKCGMCDNIEEMVRYTEVCLLCLGVVVYSETT